MWHQAVCGAAVSKATTTWRGDARLEWEWCVGLLAACMLLFMVVASGKQEKDADALRCVALRCAALRCAAPFDARTRLEVVNRAPSPGPPPYFSFASYFAPRGHAGCAQWSRRLPPVRPPFRDNTRYLASSPMAFAEETANRLIQSYSLVSVGRTVWYQIGMKIRMESFHAPSRSISERRHIFCSRADTCTRGASLRCWRTCTTEVPAKSLATACQGPTPHTHSLK